MLQRAACGRKIAAVRRALLVHYSKHARDLPWRRQRTPYEIWVSEIMLQQTQVATVLRRYAPFLKQFPSIQSLGAATQSTVCEAWAGLGYYRRACNLHRAAQIIVAQHGGKVPSDRQILQKLPGIGRYTAGAILSIAFDQPMPIVDGNVARILSRLWALHEAADSTDGRRRLWGLAQSLVSGSKPGDFNQAMMDLGATICTPKNPQCKSCPVVKQCIGHKEGKVMQLPVMVKQVAVKPLSIAFAWYDGQRGLWLKQRSVQEPLWAGLWELPSAQGPDAKAKLEQRFGITLGDIKAKVQHRLTHRLVTAQVYPITAGRFYYGNSLRPHADPLDAPLSTLARKAIDCFQRQALKSV